MADLTAFSSTNFSTIHWINSAIKENSMNSNTSVDYNESLESFTSSLLMKLRIMSQDYTDQLETVMVETMSTIPRITSEISKLEEYLRSVEEEMSSLSNQLNNFDQRNVIGVEDLSRLDILKSNMERCKATLEEHARWSQLVREAKILLESGGKLSESADRIEVMFRSLEILKNLPGNEERQETCEAFKSSLLEALRPLVRRDVTEIDTSPLHEYLYVFQKLGREMELHQEYIKARPDRVKELWENYKIDQRESFAKWLALLLGKVTRLIHDEREKTIHLFGKSHGLIILSQILCEALLPMKIDISNRLLQLQSSSAEQSYDSYRVADEFARRVLPLLHHRQISSNTDQSNISNQFEYSNIDDEQTLFVLDTIYSGFVQYSSHHVNAEIFSLKNQFIEILDTTKFNVTDSSMIENDLGSLSDYSEIFSNYSESILQACDSFSDPVLLSIQRNIYYMGGMKVKSFFRLLSNTLTQYVKNVTIKIEELGLASGNAYSGQQKSYNNNELNFNFLDEEKSSTLLVPSENNITRLEFGDVDAQVLITTAFRALQAVGRFIKKFQEIEKVTKDSLIDLNNNLFNNNNNNHNNSSNNNNNSVIDQIISNNQMNIGSYYTCLLIQQDIHASSELKSFLIAASSSSHHLSQNIFSNVNNSLLKLKASAGHLLFNLCIELPEKIVSNLSSEDVWAMNSHEDFNILKERLLPQPMIIQVGEHMLSLVPELEAFASSDALPDLLMLRGEAHALIVRSRGWQQLKKLFDLKDDEIVEQICKRSSSSSVINILEVSLFGVSSTSVITDNEYYDSQNPSAHSPYTPVGDDNDSSAAAVSFANEWLSAIADSTIGLLLVQIFEINSLSTYGCAQLTIDIEYLSNVVNAMGIRPHPLITHIKNILHRPPSSLLDALDTPSGKNQLFNIILRADQGLMKAICTGHQLK
eukprot:gene10065-13525_t